jgi:hypothetical protein
MKWLHVDDQMRLWGLSFREANSPEVGRRLADVYLGDQYVGFDFWGIDGLINEEFFGGFLERIEKAGRLDELLDRQWGCGCETAREMFADMPSYFEMITGWIKEIQDRRAVSAPPQQAVDSP